MHYTYGRQPRFVEEIPNSNLVGVFHVGYSGTHTHFGMANLGLYDDGNIHIWGAISGCCERVNRGRVEAPVAFGGMDVITCKKCGGPAREMNLTKINATAMTAVRTYYGLTP